MSDLRGIRLKSIRSSYQDSNVTLQRHRRKTSLHLVTNEASVAEIMSTVVNVLKVLKLLCKQRRKTFIEKRSETKQEYIAVWCVPPTSFAVSIGRWDLPGGICQGSVFPGGVSA